MKTKSLAEEALTDILQAAALLTLNKYFTMSIELVLRFFLDVSFKLSKYLFAMNYLLIYFEGAFSGLRKLLTTDRPLEMAKNTFYFTLKIIFVLNMFKFFVLTFRSSRKTV